MLTRIAIAAILILAGISPSFATVPSTTSRNSYTGNGSVHVYSYGFKIFSNSDLKVTVRDTDGVETLLALTTDYTVSGVGNANGGSITLVNSSQAWLDGDGDLKTGYVLVVRRVLTLTQSTDIRNQGAYYPEIHEDEFDILTMIEQQQQDELDRSMKLAETVDPADFDTHIPAEVVGNPGVSFIVNETGDGLTAGPTADDIASAEENAAAATAAASTATSAAASAAASAATINLPSITGNSLKILQANAGETAIQYMDLRAPNVGIGTVTPNAGKFTTLFTTGNVGINTAVAGTALVVNGTVTATTVAATTVNATTVTGNGTVPQGVIVMWSGTIATIPTGWELSDGSCAITCPDLRDKFVIGANQDSSGAAKTNVTGSLTQSGGSATKDISHTHVVPATSTGWGANGSITNGTLGAGFSTSGDEASASALNNLSTGSGGSTTQDVLNPYYALAFIIKD